MRQRVKFGEEARPAQPQPITPYRDKLKEWITSDCRNKECVDGGMSIDDGKTSTYYRCPICTRSPIERAPEYTGPIETWTNDDMAARLKDRKDVFYDREYRYKRGMEIMGLLKSMTR